jgi:hypothetical protein
MRFSDRALLRLADMAERNAMLSNPVGQRILLSAYDFSTQPFGAVTGVVAREVELKPYVPVPLTVRARVFSADRIGQWESDMEARGWPAGASVDAYLNLLITATSRPVATSIENVAVTDLGHLGDLSKVDARIIAEDGALPAIPTALEARRMKAMSDMLVGSLSQPADFDIVAFRNSYEIHSSTDFVAFFSQPRLPLLVGLDLVMDPTPNLISTDYPVFLSVLLLDSFVPRMSDVVGEIQQSRCAFRQAGDGPTPQTNPVMRTESPFLVVFPAAELNDPDLPLPAGFGGPPTPAAHLAELSTRLQAGGIALAPL